MRYDARLSCELADGFRSESVQSQWLAKNMMVFVA